MELSMPTRIQWPSWGYLACAGLIGVSCSADSVPQHTRPSATAGSVDLGVSGNPALGIAGSLPIASSLPIAGTAGIAAPRAGVGATAGVGASAAAGGGGTSQPPPVGTPGTWPAADPSKTGPFATTTENMVGPGMAYTMFRPKDLTQRHPVITWGNGTGTMPTTYRQLLTLYASHGFIVIASNSENVAQGDPPPMLDGVTWVLEQDMTAGTSLYQHVDRDNIGATGHSQGAFAASSAGTDPRIKTIAPIETLEVSRGLHGPALGLCGSMDTTVPCSGNLRSFNAISDQPVMYAEQMSADHTNWIFTAGGGFNPYFVITTAWFRVQLMNDTALRPMFYGTCTICQDSATWVTMRKMMDQ
jgi:hypothetical protein